jgi:hypothetical protein
MLDASQPVRFGHFDVTDFNFIEYDSADEASVVSDSRSAVAS